MTTWTFKGPATALVLMTLAACEDGQGGSFLDGLTAGSAKESSALSQARMAFGAVTLVAPEGFCIDKRSLRQRFAIMARCDTLGAPSAAGDAPLGIITASFSPAGEQGGLPTVDHTAAAFDLQNPSAPTLTENSILFRAEGTPGTEELSAVHWRGSARIGTQIVGLALYGPENGRAVSREGRRILTELIEGSSEG